jgi:hypothetical protein
MGLGSSGRYLIWVKVLIGPMATLNARRVSRCESLCSSFTYSLFFDPGRRSLTRLAGNYLMIALLSVCYCSYS